MYINILFVSRKKLNTFISPIVKTQSESLKKYLSLSYLAIEGKGVLGYFVSISKIRSFVRKSNIKLIHAHYSLSGISSSLSFSKPVVCSLMGSDIQTGRFGRYVIRFFSKYCWKVTIVKSNRMKGQIELPYAHVIPNGVNLDVFQPMDYSVAREKVGFEATKKYVLFLADPARPEKNYSLAKKACNIIKQTIDLELLALHTVPHEEIPAYLSAADALMLTSHFEGSPNAVKEAMACNCPVVSTDVGDVGEVINNTDGCYITSFEPEDVAEKLKLALEFGKRTNGRENIKHLDDKIIAKKLLEVYRSVLK